MTHARHPFIASLLLAGAAAPVPVTGPACTAAARGVSRPAAAKRGWRVDLRIDRAFAAERPQRGWAKMRFIIGGGPWCESWLRTGVYRRGRRPVDIDATGVQIAQARLEGQITVPLPGRPAQILALKAPVRDGSARGTCRIQAEGSKEVRSVEFTAEIAPAAPQDLAGFGGEGWPDWPAGFPWTRFVNVRDVEGQTWSQRFAAAQEKLLRTGDGGVVYFPPGRYELTETLRLRSGIVVRGASPSGPADARNAEYRLPTRLIFPRYEPAFSGGGTPRTSAFKGIELADPVSAARVGVVNLHLANGHIHFGTPRNWASNSAAGRGGSQWLVFGCVLRNAATLDPQIPRPWQHPWQRWTHRHRAAIDFRIGADALIANNRIPPSGEGNFVMEGFRLYKDKPATHQEPKTRKVTTVDVPFDCDNRPGIYVNADPLAKGLQIWRDYDKITDPPGEASETDIPPPHGLAKGIVIRNNYVYCTGCTAIKSSGDGTYVGFNVIRYEPGVVRPTYTGLTLSNFTNNNRAVEMRGWRWTVEGNDYEVYSNYGPDGTRYNDGEGIMFEAWQNVGIRDSRILHNHGNAYISIWRVPVRGLEVRGNHVRTPGGQAAVTVLARTNRGEALPCRNVRVHGNITEGSGIKVTGQAGGGNAITGNRHVPLGRPGRIINRAGAEVSGNAGYGR